MVNQSALDLVQRHTAELVSQQLRSAALVISRLRALIGEASRLGHSHRSIHAAIEAGGLAISWNHYRVALGRARRAQRAQPSRPTAPHAVPTFEPAIDASRGDAEHEHAESTQAPGREFSSSHAPTQVLNALAGAKQTASKDYSRIAKELHRKERR